MFVDQIKILARAGNGGRGCIAFRREAFRPRGGPSGGAGGRGGNVILEASKDVDSLAAQFYMPRLIAKNGDPGLGKDKYGRSGKDLMVKVPCGTLVWRIPYATVLPDCNPVQNTKQGKMRASDKRRALEIDLTQEKESSPPKKISDADTLVIDLTTHNQQFTLCHGGRGGKGNSAFATSTHQTPRFAQPGEPGEEGHFRLELRTIAEVGLVGYPNAGKSTLLSAISHAHPKIAAYPFTTLHPLVGIVNFPDYTTMTVCDVPGIIEGAYRNVGLGHNFLRHIRRCRVLAIMLDMAGTDGRDAQDDYDQINEELERYDTELTAKPRLVVANKMDQPESADNLVEFCRVHPEVNLIKISAANKVGLDGLRAAMRNRVIEAKQL